jgi:hypothetical protein
MKPQIILRAAALAGTVTGLFGQGLPGPDVVYQQAGAISIQTKAGGMGFFTAGPLGGPAVTGRPFSASEERHSVQTLGDGTRIDRTETDQFYRDDQGRSRTERSGDGPAITIQDPVAGFTAILDPSTKTAHKLPAPPPALAQPPGSSGGTAATFTVLNGRAQQAKAGFSVAGVAAAGAPMEMMITTLEGKGASPVSEDLGTQVVNGIAAQGTRSTLTIPAGQIGNDRAIQVVSERWFSPDLQVTVKSTNSDPRFGDVTYQLNNINRAAPDPSLFTIPADYTVQSPDSAQFKTGPKQ